jgi:spermidine synthase
MPLRVFFYIVIFIEGYVVLASELLAIRIIIPFVGNGTETISIIIAAVLMPLAIGYYAGGKYSPKANNQTVRNKLVSNLVRASFILVFGLSYAFLDVIFPLFELICNGNRIAQTALYSALFLVYPVYLLGQTVPLISNYFSSQKLSAVTGRMLCFSTMGSFFGSIISTLVLMSVIGVNYTVIVTISLLAALIFWLNKKVFSLTSLKVVFLILIVVTINDSTTMKLMGIVENNNYSTIEILDIPHEDNTRMLVINRSFSSKFSPTPEGRLDYVKYVEKTLLPPTAGDKRSILIIGAGGFTIGLSDDHNQYTYVDIDSSLQAVAEEHFLKQKLSANKKFIAEPARAFLHNNTTKYDLIFLDAYSNAMSIPTQLITHEFFMQVKNSLKPNGVIGFNAITNPHFDTKYSIKLDNTLREIFPNLNRFVVKSHNVWGTAKSSNIIYSYRNKPTTTDTYTDDKNTYFLDK